MTTEITTSNGKSSEMQAYNPNRVLAAAAFKKKLNSAPPKEKVLFRKVSGKDLCYLPISFIETELDEIFLDWESVNFRWQVVANEIIGTIDLRVLNPITMQWTSRTGAAAVLIRQSSGATNDDVNAKLKNALEGDFPHLLSDCIRNAAKKFGKRFGRDLNRAHEDTYDAYEAISITDIESFERLLEREKQYVEIKREVESAIQDATTEDDFKNVVRPALDRAANSRIPLQLLADLKENAMNKYKTIINGKK